MDKFSVLKLAKNVPDIAVTVLEVYKMVLSVKYVTADSILKGVKIYQKKQLSGQTAEVVQAVENKDEIKNVKENTSMKKSTLVALFAFLAAAVAAVVAVAAYLKRKEENLRDYEEMLFNEDYLADYMPKDDEDCCCCEDELCEEEPCTEECCCEENTAQE